MRKARLSSMVKGWFVGDFEPTCYRTAGVEVAVKVYAAGAYEARHTHRIATELTVIVSGEAEMNGVRLSPGDIVIVGPGEATDFRAVTATTTTVVKLPSVPNDKYPEGPQP